MITFAGEDVESEEQASIAGRAKGEEERRRREKEKGGEVEEKGSSRWGKNREGDQGKRYLGWGSQHESTKKSVSKEISRNSQGWSQLRPKAIVEKVPELALPCIRFMTILNVIIETLSSNWWKQAQIHRGTLDWALKVQLKSGKSENMSKDVKTMMGIPTETAYLS